MIDWRSWRWYLRSGELFIGPFRSMTDAVRHRKDYGPADAEIEQQPDVIRQGLLTPLTPERHRAEGWDQQ